VGAAGDDSGRGAAYLHPLAPLTLQTVRHIYTHAECEDGCLYASNGDQFGSAVAIKGNTALIGAKSKNMANATRGEVYVYGRTIAGWKRVGSMLGMAKVPNTSGWPMKKKDEPLFQPGYFGQVLAYDGATALVGSNGRAFFLNGKEDSWSLRYYDTAGNNAAKRGLGCGVALFGNRALVGACDADTAMANSAGAAIVYNLGGTSGTIWKEQAKLTASDGEGGEKFGQVVALAQNMALVGVPDEKGKNQTTGRTIKAIGALYIYHRTGQPPTWQQLPKIRASDAWENGRFGNALAVEGTTALVGSPGAKPRGAVYVLEG